MRRRSPRRLGVLGAIALLALLGAIAAVAGARSAQRPFAQRNLVSDTGRAQVRDPNLVNPWGMTAGPTTPLWVSDNGKDVSTLYSGAVGRRPPVAVPLVVRIPGGAPTGVVFNPTRGFTVTVGRASAPAAFIFASEAGRIAAWSPMVPPRTQAQSEVTTPSAIYKGLAIASTSRGPRLFATNFHGARIDVFDTRFAPVRRPGAFTDRAIPTGYAPFNVQALGGRLYVTYAKQDARARDDVAGPGNGFVDVYDTSGRLLRRLVSHGGLNSPWGLVMAPSGFGGVGGDLLVGNFGNGAINAYNPRSGRFDGQLTNTRGRPIRIDGLWSLRFGNGVFGTPRDLLFTAGIARERHGLLGMLTAR